MAFNRDRRQPRAPRRAVLAGSPSFPAPKADPVGDDAPKKRTTRKKAAETPPKDETDE